MDITLADGLIVNEISDEQAVLQELEAEGPAVLAAYLQFIARTA